MQQPTVIGISWFELDDYPRIRAVMADADRLHRTYSEWRLAAEQLERSCAGRVTSWCVSRCSQMLSSSGAERGALDVNAKARMQFANEGAAHKHRAIHKGPSTAQ